MGEFDTTAAIYIAQRKTWATARRLSKDKREVTHTLEDHLKPPFCLRRVKAYRTPAMQEFRDLVAATVRNERART